MAVAKTATRKVKEQIEEDAVSAEAKAARIPKKKGVEEMAEEKKVEKKGAEESGKSRLVALLLCFFLGWAGGHRFYTNKVGTGLMMLFTMGGFGMWYFLDFIMIASGSYRDKDNLPVTRWS